MILLLLATRHYYPTFGAAGRALAWLVIFGGLLGLASLTIMLVRLYVAPLLDAPERSEGNP